MKQGEDVTLEECLEGVQDNHRRSGDSLATIFTALTSFRSLFGGSVQYAYDSTFKDGYKATLIFKEEKWLGILEQAQDTISRFHHMAHPENDLELAENYQKIWNNSSLGEKLLGNLNVMMEHLEGPIAVTSYPELEKDCLFCFSDKKVPDYIREVSDTYSNTWEAQ